MKYEMVLGDKVVATGSFVLVPTVGAEIEMDGRAYVVTRVTWVLGLAWYRDDPFREEATLRIKVTRPNQ